ASGGFAGVRGEPIEDWALARRVLARGYRNHFAFGMHLVAVRQFVGLGEIWRGWRKTTYFGVRARPLLGLKMCVGSVTGLAPFIGLPFALRTMHRGLRMGSHPTDAPDTLAMIAATATLLGAALTM